MVSVAKKIGKVRSRPNWSREQMYVYELPGGRTDWRYCYFCSSHRMRARNRDEAGKSNERPSEFHCWTFSALTHTARACLASLGVSSRIRRTTRAIHGHYEKSRAISAAVPSSAPSPGPDYQDLVQAPERNFATPVHVSRCDGKLLRECSGPAAPSDVTRR